jgi:DNA topoisomerase-3
VAKSLVITEKPSVARDIAAALGDFQEHDGYWESDDYVVTFAVGHLLELLPPEEIDPEYKRWTLANLPILPERFQLKKKKGQSDRIRTIGKLLKRDDVDGVVNACDAGREGELIFREIVDFLGSEKPVRRLWLQSMTTNAIRNGFTSLRPGEELEGLAAAAQCRAYSDWLIGMNATRALTKRFKSRRERGAWSAGRVQTPTLAILVGRELEVLAHAPRPYWRVSATFDHAGASYEAAWYDAEFKAGEDEERRDDRIFEEERAQAVVAAVQGQDGEASETRKPSRESAPPLFDLTSLQREGNRRFSWSARRTLNAAQRCYEGYKILTYPRTDSRCLPADYRETVDGVLEGLASAGDSQAAEGFADYARSASRLREAGLENEKRIFDDSGVSDHFAIIPTGVIPSEQLAGDAKRLFDLVTRRFLGAFHPPAVWERVERTTVVEGHHFRTRSRSLEEPGWRAVLAAGGDEDEEVTVLPPLAPGQTEVSGVGVGTSSVELASDETKPPPRVSEARLLSLMENAGQQIEDENLAAVLHEKGIGTPATRAEVIENLIAKGYAVRVGKILRPTVKGIRLIDALKRVQIDRLASPKLTGEIESHLLDVERGRRGADDFMSEMKQYASDIVERARSFEYEEMYDHEPPIGTCPYGGLEVIEQAWFYTCKKDPSLPREAKADPDCKSETCPLLLWKDTSGRYLDRASAAKLLEEGKTGTLDGFMARSGRLYRGHLEIDPETRTVKVRSEGYDEATASDQPEYEVNPDPLGRCPFAEECAVVESPTQFVCERQLKQAEAADDDAPKPCGFVLPRTVCKRELTRDEALVYTAGGRTELLTDFTSRYGRPFSATLVLKKNGRHGFEFQPRGGGKGDDAASDADGKKKPTRKKAGGKKTGGKKTGGKKAGGKKTTRKKAARKTGGTKKATRKAAGTRKTTRKKAASDTTPVEAAPTD